MLQCENTVPARMYVGTRDVACIVCVYTAHMHRISAQTMVSRDIPLALLPPPGYPAPPPCAAVSGRQKTTNARQMGENMARGSIILAGNPSDVISDNQCRDTFFVFRFFVQFGSNLWWISQ